MPGESTSINYPEWAGRLSVLLEELLDIDVHPSLTAVRRQLATDALDEYRQVKRDHAGEHYPSAAAQSALPLPCSWDGDDQFCENDAVHRVHDVDDVGAASCYACPDHLGWAQQWVHETTGDIWGVSPVRSASLAAESAEVGK